MLLILLIDLLPSMPYNHAWCSKIGEINSVTIPTMVMYHVIVAAAVLLVALPPLYYHYTIIDNNH